MNIIQVTSPMPKTMTEEKLSDFGNTGHKAINVDRESAKNVKKDWYDVIYVRSFNNVGAGVFLKGKLNIPLIVQIQDIPFFRFDNLNSKKYYTDNLELVKKYADRVTTISETVKKEVESVVTLGVPIDVNYYGINTEAANEVPIANEREEYIIYMGGWWPHKRIIELIEMVDPLQELKIMGRGQLEGVMKKKAEGKSVSILGWVDVEEKFKILSKSKALVTNTAAEGFCVPPGEALYMNVPIIVSPLPVLKEIYGHYAHYFANAEELEDCIKKVPRVEKTGRDFIINKRLTVGDHIQRQVEILEKALDEKVSPNE